MSAGKQDTDLETPPVYYNLYQVMKSSSDICGSCLTTVPPRGTNVYNRGKTTSLGACKYLLKYSGESTTSFLASKKLKNKDCTAYLLQVEEENQGLHVSAL